MFTIEMDSDNGRSATITTLDNGNNYDDVEVFCYADVVFIRQIDDYDNVQIISMSPQQLSDIVNAMNLPEGCYY